ncbi:MAG: hypothetical protein HQK50_12295 [Oligoflexia bacterium]|nr:hypothetical protein [Oligoflexia bacterium]MBF0366346.1 hypothetical protein [Oligoflexia bacterium]
MSLFQGEDYQVVRLFYRNSTIAMDIILPALMKKKNDQFTTVAFWKQLDRNLSKHLGHLELPKFEINSTTDLGDFLKKMGMEIAFDKKLANFSKMVETTTLFIG